MLRLLFLSSTSLALVACNGDECGPPSGTQTAGLLASSADVVLNYGNIRSGVNNDCTDAASGVISMTLQGTQIEGPGLLTLCVQRPDLLQEQPQQLGTSVFVIDLNGEKDGCSYDIERLRPLTGTVTAQGLCDNGEHPAGYAITVDGAVSLKRMCPTLNDTIAVTFSGTVAVVQE